jgi:hypothetical protein
MAALEASACSRVQDYTKLTNRLKAKGRAAVRDQVIAMDAFKELVGSCPEVKLIMNHIIKHFGSALTL